MSKNKESLKDRLLARTADLETNVANNPRPSILDQKNVTMPAQLGAFRLEAERWQSKVHDLEQKLQEAQSTGLLINISDLVEVEGRRRKLTSEEYAELRENIRHNKLITPITVRSIGNGKYEVISGHNRVSVFKDLGWLEIMAVVNECDDDVADLSAFYANLLHPSLPDFEKFLGFRKRQEKTGRTNQELATESGISLSQVTRLMAFELLPTESLNILKDRPEILGATAAKDLAEILKSNKSKATPLVIAAIEEVSKNRLNQTKAAGWIREQLQPRQKAIPLKATIIKSSDNTKFCEIRRSENVLRVSFSTPEEATLLETKFAELAREFARSKPKK